MRRVEALAAAAAAALGLREGPVHAEVRLDGERAWVLELAARSIGGLCSRALRFGAGISLEEVILRHALALPLGPHARERAASGVMMLPIERAGTLREVRGVEAARAVSGVQDVRITIPRGRPVVPLPEGDRYLGFVFARGETPAQVEAALRQAHAALDVVVGLSAPAILASRMPAIDPDIIRRQAVIGAAALSPDGGRVVYTRRTVVAGRYQTSLWLVPYSGGRPRRLTHGRWNDTAPAWSPDGSVIAFASDRSEGRAATAAPAPM